ncbi:CehA/McbA family metallohydrolase [Pseudoxanthomonas sp. CF125]|uniref:CehA/McbA family metallohydrolase n=1 Tax=Pseudoxanthomonas sp. CF125 TaxID=1855303 RepID=UPI000885384B|nr:CehA/McbA family metallohydrolase [Pseudoxanthomonas sp. CF125]SDQ63379.1 WD40-like Beta Propeller Repeat [Pseudoxanthomonas sp. CF125]
MTARPAYRLSLCQRSLCLLAALLLTGPVQAAREPVLKQVDLPHSYYWRELYIPQLTTGPSSASFMPDGKALVYSRGGSLWKQVIGSDRAIELTHARSAYDYQPDISRDGGSVVFSRYDGNGIELWRLDLASGDEQPLTTGGAVNVEPRLSPDGKRLAWVSTQGSGHFNLFIADLQGNQLRNARPLLGERRSKIDRYYYSAFDHAINPSWSADGKTLYYVGNAEVAWGTGDLWAVEVANPQRPRKILSEETSWSARPELAPDGKRLLYGSYRGRQWQQLWLTTPAGVAPLPLTFGEYDRRNARWSPDGKRIAFIDNRDGNTALRVMDTVGGATTTLAPAKSVRKISYGRVLLRIVDEHGKPIPARVSATGSDARAHAPADAWMQADDGFDRAVQSSETHYFHCASPCLLDLPAGQASIEVRHGFQYSPWRQQVEVGDGGVSNITAKLQPQHLPAPFGDWVSADLHVHMNYGGHYRNTPANLVRQAQAEDLDVVFNTIVNKEERIPDIGYFSTRPDAASTARTTLLQAQEYHTSFWGHLGLLQLDDHYLTPDFSAYRHTALDSPYPHNGVIADLAHAQHGLVGYVHPFDTFPDPDKDPVLSNVLPADAINGKIDYLEVIGFSDHKATAAVWYRLLNLGLRLAAGAGTDAMANYASLRGPVGMNRVFLDTGGRRDGTSLAAALKGGHGFVSNGPLLGLLVDGRKPGETTPSNRSHAYRIALRSPVAMDHLELVNNGKVVKVFDLSGDRRSLDSDGTLELEDGWVLLRTWNDGADPQVMDLYPYATTNPVWLGDARAASAPQDAAYFARWLDRVIEAAAARDDYNDAEERSATLQYLQQARERYRAIAESRSPQGNKR